MTLTFQALTTGLLTGDEKSLGYIFAINDSAFLATMGNRTVGGTCMSF